MDVAVLAVNLTSQSQAGLAASLDPSGAPSAPGMEDMSQLFSVLLAQQIGQDFLPGKAAIPDASTASIPKKASKAGDASSADADGVTSLQADPSVLIQQATLFAQGQITPPATVQAAGAAEADTTDHEIVQAGRVGAEPLVAGRLADEVAGKRDPSRQTVAADSATFATQLSAEQSTGDSDPVNPGAAALQATQPRASDTVSVNVPVSEKSPEPKLTAVEAVSSSRVADVANPVTPGVVQPVVFAHAATAKAHQGEALPVSNIPQAVGHSAWGNMLGDRVVWMVGQQHQGVELHLNPPSLGPLEIRLSMNDGQANLSFSTQHLPVKEAIDSATPRLREMLGDSGISLGSVSVNVGSFAQQTPNDQAQSGTRQSLPAWEPVADMAGLPSTPVIQTIRNGLVDTFA